LKADLSIWGHGGSARCLASRGSQVQIPLYPPHNASPSLVVTCSVLACVNSNTVSVL